MFTGGQTIGLFVAVRLQRKGVGLKWGKRWRERGKKVLFEERNRRIAFLGHELLIYGSVFIFLLKF